MARATGTPGNDIHQSRLVYLTAGAGGMFCGSCLNDNAIAKVMPEFGWDTQLVPLYTPIRTDDADTSIDQVFFGGINVWLQQKVPFFRWLPRFADRILDNPGFIRRVTKRAIETDARFLGDMALSMLRGMDGNQRKEVRRLVQWMVGSARPDVIVITNLLVAAFVDELKRHLNVPVVVMLQGDDVFLQQLPDEAREACLREIRRIAGGIDRFLVHSHDYREFISGFLGIDAERIGVVPLGLDPTGFLQVPADRPPAAPPTVGYLARLAPEKGLHRLVDAFIGLKREPRWKDLQLRVAGWLGPECESYASEQWARLRQAGLAADCQYLGVIDRHQKLEFLQELTLLSVPTVQREPKGLFVLEALAAGVPVVLPDHGAFPELLGDLEGGKLFPNDSPEAYQQALAQMLSDPAAARRLGEHGRSRLLATRTTRQVGMLLDQVLRELIDG